MPMYNLIKHSSDYSETTGSLWFFSKDKATNVNADISNINNFKSFEYKAKFLTQPCLLKVFVSLLSQEYFQNDCKLCNCQSNIRY